PTNPFTHGFENEGRTTRPTGCSVRSHSHLHATDSHRNITNSRQTVVGALHGAGPAFGLQRLVSTERGFSAGPLHGLPRCHAAGRLSARLPQCFRVGCTVRRNPNAAKIAANVFNRGFPRSDRVLYSVSRERPVLSASATMPPIASATV